MECVAGGSLKMQLHKYQCLLAQTQLMHHSFSAQRQLPGESAYIATNVDEYLYCVHSLSMLLEVPSYRILHSLAGVCL